MYKLEKAILKTILSKKLITITEFTLAIEYLDKKYKERLDITK